MELERSLRGTHRRGLCVSGLVEVCDDLRHRRPKQAPAGFVPRVALARGVAAEQRYIALVCADRLLDQTSDVDKVGEVFVRVRRHPLPRKFSRSVTEVEDPIDPATDCLFCEVLGVLLALPAGQDLREKGVFVRAAIRQRQERETAPFLDHHSLNAVCIKCRLSA